ncbi:MAG: DUF1573 domain-containing protein [Bacteroidota bacterium]
MKKIFALFTVLCLAVSFVTAQDEAPSPTEGPMMEFETLEIDYGTIEQGSDPLRVFNFTNKGTEPLQITHAKGSCGCTVPKWPKEPIFPGEAAKIEVRYDTKRMGKFFKRVTLTTNENVEKRVISIKGEVVKKLEEPEAIPESAPSIFTSPGDNGNN